MSTQSTHITGHQIDATHSIVYEPALTSGYRIVTIKAKQLVTIALEGSQQFSITLNIKCYSQQLKTVKDQEMYIINTLAKMYSDYPGVNIISVDVAIKE
jgi:hypothetical protein